MLSCSASSLRLNRSPGPGSEQTKEMETLKPKQRQSGLSHLSSPLHQLA